MVKKRTIILFICLGIIILLIVMLVIKNHRDSRTRKKLFYAIQENDMPTIERILEDYPSLINAKQYRSDILSILCERSNPTPLLEAIRLDNVDLIKYLVENNVDVNKSKGTHTTYPIIEILHRGFGEICDIRYELAWLLIENGADLNVRQQYGTIPYAIVGVKISASDSKLQEQSLQLMKFMIEKGISLEPPYPTSSPKGDSEQYTWYKINEIIGLAARNNYVLITKYLLDNGIYNINDIVSLDGSTSLIQAVKGESFDTCKLLIAHKADIMVIDKNGKTAYDYAIEIENQEIINLLRMAIQENRSMTGDGSMS